MQSKVTKRPAEAVKEWLRRHPQPLCPICHVAPLVAAHVHKPAAAKLGRPAAPAPSTWARAPTTRPLPHASGRPAGRFAAPAPSRTSHPWLGSTRSGKPAPAPPPARRSSFAAEQERLFAEQQAREANLRLQAEARKQEKAAKAAAQAAAQTLAKAGQAAAQQAQQVHPSASGAVQQEAAALLSEEALNLMRG